MDKGIQPPMAQGRSTKIIQKMWLIRISRLSVKKSLFAHHLARCAKVSSEREFFIDNLLVRIHSIIEMILVDRPCAMGA